MRGRPRPVPSSLGDADLDALREVASVGVGSAATALSRMVARRIGLRVPSARAIPLAAIPDAAGGGETPVCGLYLRVGGDFEGHLLLLLSIPAMEALLDALRESTPGAFGRGDGLEESALQEAGNVFVSAYLNAVGGLLGMTLLPSPPGLALDMPAAVVDTVLIGAAGDEDDALVLETEFSEESGGGIGGRCFLVPDSGSLEPLLEGIRRARSRARGSG